MTIREHKEKADFGISRNLGPTAKIMIIYTAVMSLASGIMESVFVLITFILGLFIQVDHEIIYFAENISETLLPDMILGPAFIIGLSSVALTLQRGREAHHSQLWAGFKHFFKSLRLYYSCLIPSLLWGLLFIVPGIIKWYSYSMAPFIMAEDPALSAKDARCLSRELTEEYKLRIFMLDLSFAGWYIAILLVEIMLRSNTLLMMLISLILSLVTVMLFVPYRMTARADLYRYIKSQKTVDDAETTEAASADSTEEEVEFFPITDEMRQDWQKKYNRRKKMLLTAFAAIILAAAVSAALPLYNRYKDRHPREVSVEHTGYMMWKGGIYEPERVTVKLNGYIQQKVYYGDIEVEGAKGTIYSFEEIQFGIPGTLNIIRKQELSQSSDILAYAILDPKLKSIIIEKSNDLWNTDYEYIVDDGYKTEQYGNQMEMLYIYAPADSSEEAYGMYIDTIIN